MTETTDSQTLIARLNGETAKIAWHELQKHYASGNVLAVATGADLIKVAIALHRDDRDQVQQWLDDDSVGQVQDQQAMDWYDNNKLLWALVIPPFVLVQETE
ncbi:DUF2288 domain-containing protein [Porticoccaceae bacterium]|nr:DUF2288 domain-containing protein [Porticoccaceae bacterium]